MMARGIAGSDDEPRIGDRRSTIDRYELLVGLIPAAFVVAFLASRLLELPVEAAMLGGVAIATPALLDGIFFRPPTGPQGA